MVVMFQALMIFNWSLKNYPTLLLNWKDKSSKDKIVQLNELVLSWAMNWVWIP